MVDTPEHAVYKWLFIVVRDSETYINRAFRHVYNPPGLLYVCNTTVVLFFSDYIITVCNTALGWECSETRNISSYII